MYCLNPQKMLADSSYNPYFPPALCQFNMPTFLGHTLVTMLGSGSPIPEAEWGESWDSMDIPPLQYQQSLNHWKLLEANGQNQFGERTIYYPMFPFVFTAGHHLHLHHYSTSSSSFLGPRLPLPRLVSPFPHHPILPLFLPVITHLPPCDSGFSCALGSPPAGRHSQPRYGSAGLRDRCLPDERGSLCDGAPGNWLRGESRWISKWGWQPPRCFVSKCQ